MKSALIPISAMLVASTVNAQSFELDWDSTLSLSSAQHRHSDLLGEPQRQSTDTVDAVIDVQFEGYGVTALVAAKGSQVYSSDPTQSYKGELIVQELFWQGGTELFSLPVDVTLGKVRLDWGVGYGYRPLDLFKPYRRNPVGIQVEEGTGTAMASYFDLAGEWSVFYTDSSWTKQQGSELEQASEQQGVGLRRYVLSGDNEWQALAYYDDVRHGVLAGSVVTVFDDAWSMHGSAVYQNRYLGYQQGGFTSPVTLAKQSDGYQALLGLNWANATGHNVIVEYWFDSRSWSESDWKQAYQRVDTLNATNALAPLASSYAQGLSQVNLVQHNLMFHWTMNATAWSQWSLTQQQLWLDNLTPTFDLLYSPQDQGVIATQWLEYQVYDSGTASLSAELAARFMTGSRDSLYANLPDKRMIFLNLKGKF
ncbi:hypothetical protein L1D54_06110 [Vibrio brasiliensis]|uniref:hypothetical protein n=1 Tax=Vibrio brasiliensis TaxID=170652 RepID=UPI001EFEE2DF|nr:hypothetical protein [Vibrio brasiliensis]MCG9750045.1 hypothetical protein [Vibrio brasiliensis]MCG9781947.1 hypothetical protein [Vibrio brasiliensis]